MGFDLISRILFPTPQSSYGVDSFPEELIWVPKTLNPATCGPEDCVPCLFLPYSSARFLVFYLHSNAEDIGRCHAFCSSVRAQFQVHVLAVEYPGYGICPGGPCDEQRVTENAFVAFRFVREVLQWPLDSILILGRSIGCGPAISLAVRYQVSGVIIVSPMLSVKEVCKDAIGPLSYMVDERFPNKDRVPLIRSPLLVVHGQKDMMIPCRHGVELYDACRSRKLLICPKDMEHNTNLLANVTYFVLPMLQFFSLPDYCFEDIKVPSWAYDKRLSPFYNSPPQRSIFTTALGEPSVADHCETPQQPTMGCLTCPAMRGPSLGGTQDALEENSTRASFNKWLFGRKAAITPAVVASEPKKQQWTVAGPVGMTNGSGPNGFPGGSKFGSALGSPSGMAHRLGGPRTSAAIDKPGFKAPGNSSSKLAIPRVVPPPGAAAADPVPPPPRTGGHFGGPHPQPSPQAPLTPPPHHDRPAPPEETALAPLLAGTAPAKIEERTASRNRFSESVVMATPPWCPSNKPSEPKPGEGPFVPLPPTPQRPPSPSSSLKLLTPVDLVEIVEDLERHFAAEGMTANGVGGPQAGPRPPPASAPCTPAGNWRSIPNENPRLKHRSDLSAPRMPLSSMDMGRTERAV